MNLPAQIFKNIAKISSDMTPRTLKALDHLIGAGIDIPTAWLEQKKAQIDVQTDSYKRVEESVAEAAALRAGVDSDTVQRAMNVLVRKEYRRQQNREAVATVMIENILEYSENAPERDPPPSASDLDDDWLNVFERYAEDASSERLQGLWGRVLSGEIRRPGRFSMRTLRFLSEFSQADALAFENFSKLAFADIAPKNLVKDMENIGFGHILNLEATGLIQGATGLDLRRKLKFGGDGFAYMFEGDLAIVFKGDPNTEIEQNMIALTSLGQELLSLVPSRNACEAAKVVALALREPKIQRCLICVRVRDASGKSRRTLDTVDTLW